MLKEKPRVVGWSQKSLELYHLGWTQKSVGKRDRTPRVTVPLTVNAPRHRIFFFFCHTSFDEFAVPLVSRRVREERDPLHGTPFRARRLPVGILSASAGSSDAISCPCLQCSSLQPLPTSVPLPLCTKPAVHNCVGSVPKAHRMAIARSSLGQLFFFWKKGERLQFRAAGSCV